MPLISKLLFRRTSQIFVLWVAVALFGGCVQAGQPITVFAAASLKTALDEVAANYEETHGNSVSLSYGGSSTLARQIQYGAPAQIFVSANARWMDFLQADGLIEVPSRVDILTNRLVLISSSDNRTELVIKPGFDLTDALGEDRISMALIDAVPAGIYGKSALQSLGIWSDVQDRVAQSDNVRAALMLVAIGETPLGIVYATDALSDPRVHIVDEFPANSHDPILYPAALTKGSADGPAREFLNFLTAPSAQEVFRQYGFGLPEDGS